MTQIRFDELGEETMPPSWPECFKTCANFSNVNEDGSLDYFMDWGRNEPDLSKPRCVLGIEEGNMKHKLVDNIWKSACKLYERR